MRYGILLVVGVVAGAGDCGRGGSGNDDPECIVVGPYEVCNELGRVVEDPPELLISGLAMVREPGVTDELCAWVGSEGDPRQVFACAEGLDYPLAVEYPQYFEIWTDYQPSVGGLSWSLCALSAGASPEQCLP